MSWGLYVHIPFCRRKCFYCDFVSYSDCEELMPRYVDALITEMRGKKRLLNITAPPLTVYMGGGTPTTLPPPLFARLAQAIRRIFFSQNEENFTAADAPPEFTAEANPGTTDEAYLTQLKNCGVNRLSLGAQSFDAQMLRRLGRIHSPADIYDAVAAARKIGFDNINIDIMYALPNETLPRLRADIAAALSLGAPHISVYGLTVEPNTKFAALQAANALPLPADDTVDAMYEFITHELPAHGLMRYEISNYAVSGYESRHNTGYWQYRPYIGIGAAAHSFWRTANDGIGRRFYNPSSLKEYFKAAESENFWGADESPRNMTLAVGEFCFLALRTAKGIDKKKFAALFKHPIEHYFAAAVEKLKERGAIEEKNEHLTLTSLGAKYGNAVFAEFV